MPDPLDELDNFSAPGLTMTPLPAAEVRRRGTRMRRRNTALATVGAVAAVALVATPIALAASGTGDAGGTPDPAETPTATAVTWVTTIPPDFPLTSGLPETNGHDGSPVEARAGYEPQAVDVCDGEGWTPAETTDVQQATYTGESEGGQERTLALYPSERAAGLAMQSQTAQVQACVIASEGEGRSAEVISSDDDTLVYADHMSDAGDMFVHRVVRVGNALLLDSTYAMGGGDPDVVQQTADLLEEKSGGTVDAMCVFSADPC
ncbi:hypothetical protein [Nocardioides sp. YIM 152315]|uniref:hypothetical protein n=1 Tax=Nocardioides sp. YIM 152315 TaxID=3031760 RepID=UPI0023DC4036|nr:hypothetical protein [Nocardioides sp. YIM 152315]MDF1602336.1 hypothetical protein [Nocardioides sp. YIM 152315]